MKVISLHNENQNVNENENENDRGDFKSRTRFYITETSIVKNFENIELINKDRSRPEKILKINWGKRWVDRQTQHAPI